MVGQGHRDIIGGGWLLDAMGWDRQLDTFVRLGQGMTDVSRRENGVFLRWTGGDSSLASGSQRQSGLEVLQWHPRKHHHHYWYQREIHEDWIAVEECEGGWRRENELKEQNLFLG